MSMYDLYLVCWCVEKRSFSVEGLTESIRYNYGDFLNYLTGKKPKKPWMPIGVFDSYQEALKFMDKQREMVTEVRRRQRAKKKH